MNNYVFLIQIGAGVDTIMTGLGATIIKTYTNYKLWYLTALTNPFDADTPPAVNLWAGLLLPNPL